MKPILFWEMLGAYETATILEARAIGERRFEELEALGDQKSDLLRRMEGLGRSLGIDRRHPELRSRLEALQKAEAMNLEALSEMGLQLRGETEQVQITRRRLTSLRGVYASGPADGFFCEEA